MSIYIKKHIPCNISCMDNKRVVKYTSKTRADKIINWSSTEAINNTGRPLYQNERGVSGFHMGDGDINYPKNTMLLKCTGSVDVMMIYDALLNKQVSNAVLSIMLREENHGRDSVISTSAGEDPIIIAGVYSQVHRYITNPREKIVSHDPMVSEAQLFLNWVHGEARLLSNDKAKYGSIECFDYTYTMDLSSMVGLNIPHIDATTGRKFSHGKSLPYCITDIHSRNFKEHTIDMEDVVSIDIVIVDNENTFNGYYRNTPNGVDKIKTIKSSTMDSGVYINTTKNGVVTTQTIELTEDDLMTTGIYLSKAAATNNNIAHLNDEYLERMKPELMKKSNALVERLKKSLEKLELAFADKTSKMKKEVTSLKEKNNDLENKLQLTKVKEQQLKTEKAGHDLVRSEVTAQAAGYGGKIANTNKKIDTVGVGMKFITTLASVSDKLFSSPVRLLGGAATAIRSFFSSGISFGFG